MLNVSEKPRSEPRDVADITVESLAVKSDDHKGLRKTGIGNIDFTQLA